MSDSFDPSTMVNVASFGAIGNGTTDDASAIQSAETAALASGKALYFGTGTYLVGSTVSLYSGINIVGAGATIQATGACSTAFATSFSSTDNTASPAPVTNISVSGLTISGNSALQDPGSAGSLVVAWRANNIQFTNDTFENTPRAGAMMSDVENSGFTGCTFTNVGNTQADGGAASNDTFGQGVAFTSDNGVNSNNSVNGCTFTGIGLDAISATSQQNFSVSGNSLTDLSSLPESFWDSKSDGSAGVYLDQDDSVRISGNQISGASGNGMDIVNSSDLSIANNQDSGSGGSGIIFGNDSNVNVISNSISNNNQYHNHFFFQAAITISDNMWGNISGTSNNIYISDNTLSDTQADATQNWAVQVNMYADPQDVTIASNNTISGNVIPDGVGSNGIAQGWVQSWDNQVQTVGETSGGTPWVPTATEAPSVHQNSGSGGGATWVSFGTPSAGLAVSDVGAAAGATGGAVSVQTDPNLLGNESQDHFILGNDDHGLAISGGTTSTDDAGWMQTADSARAFLAVSGGATSTDDAGWTQTADQAQAFLATSGATTLTDGAGWMQTVDLVRAFAVTFGSALTVAGPEHAAYGSDSTPTAVPAMLTILHGLH